MKNAIRYITYLFHVFSENDIDMKTLLLLTEDMMKELIPMVGRRARKFQIITHLILKLKTILEVSLSGYLNWKLNAISDTPASTLSSSLQVERTKHVKKPVTGQFGKVSEGLWNNTRPFALKRLMTNYYILRASETDRNEWEKAKTD
ncbi:hypothetical protein QTP88_029493 [Uroleucon formosanum]